MVIFNNHKAQKITVYVRAGKDNVKGQLKLDLPSSWQVGPSDYTFELSHKNSEQIFEFDVTPPEDQEVAYARPVVIIDGQEYSFEYSEIEYSHIPFQIMFENSNSKFV